MPYVKQYGIRQGFKQDLEQERLEAAKQAGSPVYKYVSAHRAVDCLKEGTLYLASPDQLNDTLEARFNKEKGVRVNLKKPKLRLTPAKEIGQSIACVCCRVYSKTS